MKETQLQFLGTTACNFDKGDDCPIFFINGKYLFDTGFSVVNQLVNNDIDPLDIKYLFFTHMHHDHYMALPALIFSIYHRGGNPKDLKIIGPAADVERVVDNALAFLGYGEAQKPEIIKLNPGDKFETEDMTFETCASIHGVQGLCYRITDRETGKIICATGDTELNPALHEFFDVCDLLIHEISLGVRDDYKSITVRYGHSTVQDAVILANDIGAKKMFFVHNTRRIWDDVKKYCDENYNGEAIWPEIGKIYTI